MDNVEAATPQTPFVGREREQELYLKKFLGNNTPWVLIITGLGGIGKTTLLEHLAQSTPRDIGVCKLDFNEGILRTNSLEILKRLVEQIQPYGDSQHCEALLEAIVNDQLQLDQAKDIKMPLDEDIAILDGKSAFGKDDAATKEIELQMRETLIEDFYEQIDMLQLDRLVLMLDTCEILGESDGWEIGQWVFNDLVPELHNRLQLSEKQCFVVIASRFKPQLGRIDRQDQQYLALAMLDKNAVDQYLRHVGMEDAQLRQRVFDITHGHALSVSIIGSICQEQGTKSFSEADFPALQEEFNERASMQFVNERILERLKSPYRELTRYGVLLRSFNLPVLRVVFPDLLPEPEAVTIFEQLVRYPYIESFGNYTYSFHELLREVIADKTQQQEGPEKEQWKKYHKRALDYFTTNSPHSPDWYYHALAWNEKQGLASWLQAMLTMGPNQGKILLQVAYDNTLRLSPKGCAIRDYEQGLFNYRSIEWLNATGNVQQAASKRKEALENFQSALTLFQQIGDNAGETLAQEAIDALQQSSGTRPVLLHYGQAVHIPSPPLANTKPDFSESATEQSSKKFSLASSISHRSPLVSLTTRKGRTILLIALALLVIVGSTSIFYIARNQATKAEPQATATSAYNDQQATATAAEPQATATSAYNDLQATAVASGLQDFYNQTISHAPIVNDPLNTQSNYNWDVVTDDKGDYCKFSSGAYHVRASIGYINTCNAQASNFASFTYQIDVTFTSTEGDVGIIFRSDQKNNFYWFFIGADDSYGFYKVSQGSSTTLHFTALLSGSSSSINSASNQRNLLSVVARSSNFFLFINKQYVASTNDNSYSSGSIGVSIDSGSNSPGEATFQNAQLWVQ